MQGCVTMKAITIIFCILTIIMLIALSVSILNNEESTNEASLTDETNTLDKAEENTDNQ